jgi:hypothetical protein
MNKNQRLEVMELAPTNRLGSQVMGEKKMKEPWFCYSRVAHHIWNVVVHMMAKRR